MPTLRSDYNFVFCEKKYWPQPFYPIVVFFLCFFPHKQKMGTKGMLTREQLLHLFERFSELTAQPGNLVILHLCPSFFHFCIVCYLLFGLITVRGEEADCRCCEGQTSNRNLLF